MLNNHSTLTVFFIHCLNFSTIKRYIFVSYLLKLQYLHIIDYDWLMAMSFFVKYSLFFHSFSLMVKEKLVISALIGL